MPINGCLISTSNFLHHKIEICYMVYRMFIYNKSKDVMRILCSIKLMTLNDGSPVVLMIVDYKIVHMYLIDEDKQVKPLTSGNKIYTNVPSHPSRYIVTPTIRLDDTIYMRDLTYVECATVQRIIKTIKRIGSLVCKKLVDKVLGKN